MSGHPILPADPITLPLLPLRDVVVFPHMVIPLFVGRPKSIKALEAAMEAGRQIMLVAQKAAGKDEPKADDMFEIGCVSSILQMLKLPDGTVKVLVEGIQRATTSSISDDDEHFVGEVVPVPPDGRRHARDRGAAPRRDAAVRPVRQAEQEDPARDPDLASPASTTRAAWPTPSPRTCRSSSRPSSRCSTCSRSPSGWRSCSNCSSTRSTSCRSKSASVAASSARWRRASASTTSTSRSRRSRRNSATAKKAPTWRSSRRRSRPRACPRKRARRPTASSRSSS